MEPDAHEVDVMSGKPALRQREANEQTSRERTQWKNAGSAAIARKRNGPKKAGKVGSRRDSHQNPAQEEQRKDANRRSQRRTDGGAAYEKREKERITSRRVQGATKREGRRGWTKPGRRKTGDKST